MTEAYFNKDAPPPAYGWLHALNAALLLALWSFTIGAYAGLPDEVPGHVGPGGVTRWDAKQNSPWFILPIIALINAAMMYGISAAARSGPAGFNVPARDKLKKLPREGQIYALEPMRGFMFGLATWLLVLTLYMQYRMYRIAVAGPGADVVTVDLLFFTGFMLAVVLGMAFHASHRVKRRIRAFQSMHGAGVIGVATMTMLLLAACAPAAPPDTAGAPEAGRDTADSWAAVREDEAGTIRVLYVPAGGFAYTDAHGRLTGVTVDLMRIFAEWVGQEHGAAVEVEFVEETDWRTFYSRVRDAGPGVFGIGNVTITEARRAELVFSPPYLTNVAVLITHADVVELTTPADASSAFRGLDALAFEGTLHETRLRALRDAYVPDANVAMATSNDEILERVAAGGYFAYIDAYNFWRAQEQGAPLRRHPAADDPAEEFGVIMPLGTDWAPLLAEFFERDGGWRNTPEYRRLLVRHLGEPLTAALEEARHSAVGT
jgi:ABC-type amino acid transport substrate-binding protein